MKILKAPDGYYYTQAADVPAPERIFADSVYLGPYDAPENWRLADQEEKDAATELAPEEALKIITGNE